MRLTLRILSYPLRQEYEQARLPPTHPGEMLLEKLKPMKITDTTGRGNPHSPRRINEISAREAQRNCRYGAATGALLWYEGAVQVEPAGSLSI